DGMTPPDPGIAAGLFVALIGLFGVMAVLVLVSTAMRRREFDAAQVSNEERIAVEKDLLLKMYFRMENAKPGDDPAAILAELQELSWNLTQSRHSGFAAALRGVTSEEVQRDAGAVFARLKATAKKLLDEGP